eukprot:766084-Hanusia_phi.AAC.1
MERTRAGSSQRLLTRYQPPALATPMSSLSRKSPSDASPPPRCRSRKTPSECAMHLAVSRFSSRELVRKLAAPSLKLRTREKKAGREAAVLRA